MKDLFNTEIAEKITDKDVTLQWATKVVEGLELSAEEVEISKFMDKLAKEIGNTNNDPEHIISQLVKKTIEPDVYDPDDGLLSSMFNMGNIGEFDEKTYEVLPKDTIKVYDAVRGGNVYKSFLDVGLVNPTTVKLQAETEIKMSDLRRNGYKSIANLILNAQKALDNEKYFRVLQAIDIALAGGTTEQTIKITGQKPLMEGMTDFAIYLNDRGENAFMVGLSKYTTRLTTIDGFAPYMSEEMKNEFYRTGALGLFEGVRVNGFSSDRKTGDGRTLIPDNRLLGVTGKIGDLDMKGDLRILQEENINTETIHLKFTGYDMTYAIYRLDKIARVMFS